MTISPTSIISTSRDLGDAFPSIPAIYRLPAELLFRILLESVDHRAWFLMDPSLQRHWRGPQTLAKVSKPFLQAVLSSPLLWTTLPSTATLEEIRSILERNPNGSFDVIYDSNVSATDNFLSSIAPETIHRWRSLSCNGTVMPPSYARWYYLREGTQPDPDDFTWAEVLYERLIHLLGQKTPCLMDLQINLPSNGADGWAPPLGDGAPIRDLRLANVLLDWSHCRLMDLSSLELILDDALHLNKSIKQLLVCCTRLQRLAIHSTSPQEDLYTIGWQNSDPLTLPCLESLVLSQHSGSDLDEIFQNVMLPACKYLRFKMLVADHFGPLTHSHMNTNIATLVQISDDLYIRCHWTNTRHWISARRELAVGLQGRRRGPHHQEHLQVTIKFEIYNGPEDFINGVTDFFKSAVQPDTCVRIHLETAMRHDDDSSDGWDAEVDFFSPFVDVVTSIPVIDTLCVAGEDRANMLRQLAVVGSQMDIKKINIGPGYPGEDHVELSDALLNFSKVLSPDRGSPAPTGQPRPPELVVDSLEDALVLPLTGLKLNHCYHSMPSVSSCNCETEWSILEESITTPEAHKQSETRDEEENGEDGKGIDDDVDDGIDADQMTEEDQ